MTQPTHQLTWSDERGTWRVEFLAGRWQLSRWAPSSLFGGAWRPIGSYPNRAAALEAARDLAD
jgi:hypothetical protein